MKIIIEINQFDIKPQNQKRLIRKLEACGIMSADKSGEGCNVHLSDKEIQHLLKLTRAFYREDVL